MGRKTSNEKFDSIRQPRIIKNFVLWNFQILDSEGGARGISSEEEGDKAIFFMNVSKNQGVKNSTLVTR